MFLWRKSAHPGWVETHADILQAAAQGKLVIVERPAHKRVQLEVACNARTGSQALLQQFGGRVEELPHNWLDRFTRASKTKAIKIGKRLIIAKPLNGGRRCSHPARQRNPASPTRPDVLSRAHATAQVSKTHFLLIPASMAFGTGDHATTTMALRLLEKLTRRWKRGWSVVDLGTGTGILALTAKRFGAERVVGIDVDATAISIAESNARLNQIHGISFRLLDVRKWTSAHAVDVIIANLYSELLIEILSKLRHSGWLILSGILRSQETELLRALLRNNIETINIKRHGKWIAILARVSSTLRPANLTGGKFLRRS